MCIRDRGETDHRAGPELTLTSHFSDRLGVPTYVLPLPGPSVAEHGNRRRARAKRDASGDRHRF
eukprot:3245207-Alexandrium_andersonii.AAC.1